MKSLKIMLVAAMLLAGSAIFTIVSAQESLVGKYSGRYIVTDSRGEHTVRIVLNITGIENGNVKGTAQREGSFCRGDYLIEGAYKENHLVLTSNKGGRWGDCTTNFRLVSEGMKLKGTLEQYPVELSK